MEELEELKRRIAMLENTVMSCIEKIDSVDNLLVNEIINPIADAYSKKEDEYNYEQFKNKYGSRLDPYSKTLSAIEAEDKDVTRTAFDTYRGYDEDTRSNFSEEQYVDLLVTELDKYINKVREVFGLPENTEVEIKSTGDGEVSVKAEGTEIGTATEEPKPVEKVEEKVEEEDSVSQVEPNSEEENESKKFYEELMRDRKKYMRK